MIDPQFYTKTEESSKQYGRFVLEPLQASFGNSLGNALRRTLLSSIPGATIGYIKFEQAPHLFTTIPGVKESVLDLLLNLKQVRFITDGEGPYNVHLTVKGAKKVYARDIKGEVKAANEDLYIGEITDSKAQLDVKAIVEVGYGFVPSEEKEKQSGLTAVDSAFSPVKRVNFRIEEARVGRKSNFDRLIVEIWTDGTISPEDALKEAAMTLSKHFGHVFVTQGAPSDGKEVSNEANEQERRDAKMNDVIIDELNLPSRVINALLRENIETVADLVKRGKDELVGLKGVGRKSIELIEEELRKMGIELK